MFSFAATAVSTTQNVLLLYSTVGRREGCCLSTIQLLGRGTNHHCFCRVSVWCVPMLFCGCRALLRIALFCWLVVVVDRAHAAAAATPIQSHVHNTTIIKNRELLRYVGIIVSNSSTVGVVV